MSWTSSAWRSITALLSSLLLALLHPLIAYPDDPSSYAPREMLVKYRTEVSAKPIASNRAQIARKLGVLMEEPLVRPGGLRATKPGMGRTDLEAIFKLTLPTGSNVREAVEAYRASGLVEYAQPNHLYRGMGVPDDPRFPEQEHLRTINWLPGWERRPVFKKTPIIAIIDSGIDYTHEDLSRVVWTNQAEILGRPGADDDGNGYVDDSRGWDFADAPSVPGTGDYLDRDNDPMDDGGHGTHVAGIAGAAVNNGLGIAGACPGSTLMALRAGFTFEGVTYLEDDDIAAAIAYAVENGADVINASWGCTEISPVLRDAVRYAAGNGVVFVAAAGNEGRSGLVYPAALSEAISVGALETGDRLATFSNFGEGLDLVAPGVGVLSTRSGGGYQTRSGTSQAAPNVSGVAAWVLGMNPHLAPEQVRAALKRSATDLGPLGRDARFGSGRLDAAAALEIPAAPGVMITSPESGFGVSADTEVSGMAGGEGTGFRLEWGLGTDPGGWNLIAQGQSTGRLQGLGRWSVGGLQDSLYTLRLMTSPGGEFEAESRVIVVLDRTSPVFLSRTVAVRLDSERTEVFVEWQTDDRAFATAHIRSADGSEIALDSPYISRHHIVPLPEGLPDGLATVSITARNVSGLSSRCPDTTFTVARERVRGQGFSQVATLPDGYLINRASDFDGDGVQEIALMPYV